LLLGSGSTSRPTAEAGPARAASSPPARARERPRATPWRRGRARPPRGRTPAAPRDTRPVDPTARAYTARTRLLPLPHLISPSPARAPRQRRSAPSHRRRAIAVPRLATATPPPNSARPGVPLSLTDFGESREAHVGKVIGRIWPSSPTAGEPPPRLPSTSTFCHPISLLTVRTMTASAHWSSCARP
jgi:hypothetical protein